MPPTPTPTVPETQDAAHHPSTPRRLQRLSQRIQDARDFLNGVPIPLAEQRGEVIVPDNERRHDLRDLDLTEPGNPEWDAP